MTSPARDRAMRGWMRHLGRLRNAAGRTESPTAAELSAPGVLLRAAGLLRGGVSSARVWAVLAAEESIADRPDGPEWRVVAAANSLAAHSGAPLAATYERLATALRALDRVAERRAVLLAGPRATIRLVTGLPPAALVLGVLLGFDPVAVMLTPLGLLLLVLGGCLLAGGYLWASHLTARLARLDVVAGLECEFAWIALSGGAPPGVALRSVADHADRAGAEWVRLDRLRRDGPVQTVFAAAAALGSPVGPLLLAEAESERSRAQAELEAAAERLGVRVLLPLAVCILPSFVLLGVVPVLLAVLQGVLA